MRYLRRLQSELRLFQRNAVPKTLRLRPSDDNILLWYFAILNLTSSEDYAGGVYLGILQIPIEYPFQQPEIVLLTPNGRFRTGQPICVRKDEWSPRWNLQTLLLSFVDLFLEQQQLNNDDKRRRQRYAQNSQAYNRANHSHILELLELEL